MAKTGEPERLPRSDIPPSYECPYPDCSWKRPENKRPELTFRNHMAQQHGVYYEKAPPSETSKKLEKYARHASQLAEMEEITQLASWHCAALAKAEITGLPLSDVAKEVRHSPETLRAVARSPAAQKYVAEIRSNMHDPVKTVKHLLSAGMVNKLVDWEMAWQQAVANKDYEAVHRMAKDIGLQPALETQQQQGPTKISLHLNMTDLAAPAAKSTFTVMEEPEFEVLDDDT